MFQTRARGASAIVIVFATSACGPGASPPITPATSTSLPPAEPASTPTTPPPRQCTVLGVDWCNRMYGKELDGLVPRQLVEGNWEEHLYACDNGEHTTTLFMFRTAMLGDLDLDGRDDAIVAVDEHYYGCGDLGSYGVTHLMAFRVADAVATPLADTTGNRLRDWALTVENGQLRRTHPGPCVERWTFAVDKLEPVGPRCVPR